MHEFLGLSGETCEASFLCVVDCGEEIGKVDEQSKQVIDGRVALNNH